MTDHLADARAAFAAAAATGWPEDALTEVISQIIDHLEAQQTEASLRRGLADITAGRTVDLGSFAQPEPQPETDPACRERWPECRQGGYDPACCRFPKSCSCDASPQPVTAPPAAQQGDSGHGDGGEAVQAAMAVLCDMGADSGGWHSWRCFDRLYPEPCDCTKQATRAAIAAAEPHIRAKTLAPIRAALADHPRCDIHPDDDPIKCGWERAVADIQAVLDREEQP